MSLIKGIAKLAFAGIKPSWKKLFLGELKDQLNVCFRKLNTRLIKLGVTVEMIEENGFDTYIRPGDENIFEAFKYCEISDIRCIIVGQDPYPNELSAHGLSFSSQGQIPASLHNVFKCLIKQKLMVKEPKNGNLTKWAKQGVLLLNRYLTRNPNIVDEGEGVYVKNDGGSQDRFIHTFWSEFTDAIVKHLAGLAEKNKSYLCIMLWGNKAQEMEGAIAHEIMHESIDLQTWTHPSGILPINMKPGPKNFENCDHFTHVNEELSKRNLPIIDWDTCPKKKVIAETPVITEIAKKEPVKKEIVPINPAKFVAYTDGGCSGNGKSHAKASYGISFPKTFKKENNMINGNISGLVPIYTITEFSKGIFKLSKSKIQPSNNRGELLAVIIALDKMITISEEKKYTGPWLIVMDSEYSMHIVNERIWKWVKKDAKFSANANPDLLQIVYKQLVQLEKMVDGGKLLQPAAANHYTTKKPMDLNWKGLTILHQNSHLKTAPTDPFEFELYSGNEAADQLCTNAYENKNYDLCEKF